MRTFFIYDAEYCKSEEDDPKDALLYFFPSQKYGNQRYSLCCQIVGVAKFFKATFSSPSIIEMEQEKFALHWAGKYLIVLGGAPDCHGNILKRQLLYLCGLFCFYHGSLNNLLKVCRNDRKEFLAKLDLSWSRYITFIQCFNNMLQIPVNALSVSFVKEHGDVINKSNQLLHMCQMSSSVVAGAVFCNNRVLSSQLTPELSSYVTLMSNENASAPVGNVAPLPKSLPVDVQLKYVYLNRKIIQSIVKYNHAYVGSSVRIKTNGKAKGPSQYESFSSGSEGDVDSGNCTEICLGKKEATAEKSKPFELNFKTQLLCCSMHSTIFKRDLLKSRNKTFLKYINSEYISEKLKIFKRKASTFLNSSAKSKRKQKTRNATSSNEHVPSFNLPCHHHADILSTSFISKSMYSHLNLSSTCDLEYSCYFCINHQFSIELSPQSLKSWNSNMQIPNYLHHISLKPCVLERDCEKHKAKKEKASKFGIQVLKCRLKNNVCSQTNETCLLHSSEKKVYFTDVEEVKSKNLKHQVYRLPQNLFNTERYWECVDHNRLEKSVLYVQRYGASMLVLLLNKNYDENILTYLWNCGFSFLKDLDYQIDTKVEEGLDLIDPMHFILMYDASQKVLKERPYNYGTMFSEKHLKESVQVIQENFQLHSKMKMMTILSASHVIYACQNNQQSSFYLQQDQNTRKLESLVNLSKKAIRRLEKYTKISP